jgi:L-amino acid N-acyltransferase YncA
MIKIRPAMLADVPELTLLINRIIAVGGTTAHETPFDESRFVEKYISNPKAISCHVAEDASGRLIGYQVLGRSDQFPPDWAEVGTFVDPAAQRSGAGAALFAATLAVARAAHVVTIDATIRADNAPGRGYYTKRGFRDYATDPEYRLKDGTRVGRVSKRFDLG